MNFQCIWPGRGGRSSHHQTDRREVDPPTASSFGTLPDDPRIDYLLAHDFPFVAMGRSEHVEPYPYVDIDSDKAAYVGTSHLLKAAIGASRW